MGSKLEMSMTPNEVEDLMNDYAWLILYHAEACYEMATEVEKVKKCLAKAHERILELEAKE